MGNRTTYLDYARLDAVDEAAFRSQKPYPRVNPAQLLTEEGYQALRETLPDVSLFTPSFGVRRSHGQRPHDRFLLEYDDSVEVARPWREFIEELRGPRYTAFLRRLFGRRLFLLFHWHYAPRGCSVSPHCDAKRKLGSHIFYFNTEEDWDPAWGGETLVLDDGGRFDRASAPAPEEFDAVVASEALGNRSFIFARRGNSWHGVREVHCPEGRMRQVFIVVVNGGGLANRVRHRLRSGRAAY